jgi:hypothetical protein
VLPSLYRVALPMVRGVRPTFPAPWRPTDSVQLVSRWPDHQVRPEIRICVSDFSGLSGRMGRGANTGGGSARQGGTAGNGLRVLPAPAVPTRSLRSA